ncbi:MAG: two-component regulator propeller domain-containing protein [Gammaproteobacteria bacterium]
MTSILRPGALLLLSIIVSAAIAQSSSGPNPPQPVFDATWPQMPLPFKWEFEGITGLTVDQNDVIWVLQRPGDYDADPIFGGANNRTNYASLDPPTASCCLKPEAVLAFSQDGRLLHHWDLADEISGHLILADSDGNIWVGTNTISKYTTQGRLLAKMSRAENLRPDPGDVAPETPLIVGRVEGGFLDEDARELYVTDSYLHGRVLVFDMDTFAFKRGWGAYGKPLAEIGLADHPPYTPGNHAAPDFRGHVTVALSADGEVYVADRNSNRIQVFTKGGGFLREFVVAPETLGRGSTGGLAFSPRPDQTYLYVPDIMNNVVWIVNRADGETLGHFGYFGRNGGGFHWLHMVATDSSGNVYTGEVDTGKRVQRFVVTR